MSDEMNWMVTDVSYNYTGIGPPATACIKCIDVAVDGVCLVARSVPCDLSTSLGDIVRFDSESVALSKLPDSPPTNTGDEDE